MPLRGACVAADGGPVEVDYARVIVVSAVDGLGAEPHDQAEHARLRVCVLAGPVETAAVAHARNARQIVRPGPGTGYALDELSLIHICVKGGAAGGGYAQVVPMEDINLHFTGDFHAIGAANNLLAAMLDNHIQQGNALGIDPKQITWKRAVDMNDRQLRHIVDGLGGRMQGVPREDGFEITVASEVMAVLCLASDIMDLKQRLARIIVGYTYDGKPVTAHDLKAEGAMAALLKDCLLYTSRCV